MKVLMVNKFLFPNGGSETYVFELGRALEKRGCEIEYFGMDSENRCVSNSLDCYVDEIDYASVSFFKKLASPVKTVYSKEAKKKIGKVLDNFKPDIVHLNNINFQLTPSIIYEIKKRGIPIVQTVHDTQIACPNHRMYIEQEERVCSECTEKGYKSCIKNRCVHASLLQSAIAAAESTFYHKKHTYDLIDRFICPSAFIADMITKGGADKNKITVLHNYSPSIEVKNTESGGKYILYFGRLSIEKGLKLLFDVMAELEDVRFLIAGTGPLEEELKSRGLKNAEFLGFKSGDELYSLISGAAASVCPSQCYENCPMSAIESINLGTPVITCDIGGTKELIENGKSGFIYEAENAGALKNAIETLYRDDELIKEMKNYCLNNPCADTIDTYAEKAEKIYKDLIK